MSKVAQDHVQLADTITAQVTEPLKALERRNESLKRKVRAVCCNLSIGWQQAHVSCSNPSFTKNCYRNVNVCIWID